ncbi:MAG TPA: anti-sigma factor [Rubrobacteraceae bacterium]|nr:anti-sigma factor [Rubrobacteraceae bacterium]
MNDLEHRRMRDLLGPYVLGGLDPEEELEITDHLSNCARCRDEEQELRQAHEYMSDLAGVFEAPPPELKSRATRAVRLRGPRWAWLTAAAALVVLIGLAAAYSTGVFDSQEAAAATLKPTQLAPEAGGEIWIKGSGQNVKLRLDAWGLPPCKGDQYYELWFVEGKERLSAGSFTVGPSGKVKVDFTAPALSREYRNVGITSETTPDGPGPSKKKMLGGELNES